MTMARSLIATLIFPIALLGCPLLACSQQATGRSSADVPLAKSSDALDDTNKKKRQDGWLLRFLFEMGAKPNSFDYVLREIDLTDQQRRKLIYSAEEFLKNYREKSQVVNGLISRNLFEKSKQLESDLADATAKRDEVMATQLKQVRAELLDHQVSRLIQIVKQRIYVVADDFEPFEYPLLAKDLNLKPDQRVRLKANVAEQKSLFKTEKQQLQKEAWLSILKELPAELKAETIRLMDPDAKLGIGETATEFQKKQSLREPLNQKDLHYRHLFFFSLATAKSRQRQLDLSPAQVAEITDANHTFWDEFQQLGEEKGRVASLLQKGELDKDFYERLREKNKQTEELLKRKFDTTVEKTLLPHQLDRIALYAKRRRLMMVRDEFEVPVLVANEMGVSQSQIRKMARHIQTVRKKFYAKLNEKRERRSKNVLNSMDKEVRRQFDSQYNTLYDFRAEEASELIGEPIK